MSIESPPRATIEPSPGARSIAFKRALPSYELPDSDLPMGMSLGNSALFVITRRNGVIERVFSNALGKSPFGTMGVLFALCGGAPNTASTDYADEPFVVLRPDHLTRRMELHPAYQRGRFTIAGSVAISDTAFVPLNDLSENESDPPFIYQIFEVSNTGESPHVVRATVFARLSGAMSADVRARYDEGASALVIRDRVHSRLIRFVGLSAPDVRYETTTDFARASNPRQEALSNSTAAEGDILGLLQCDFPLDPGERQTFALKLAVYIDETEAEAIDLYKTAPSAEDAFRSTLAYAAESFNTTEVLTPDPVINAGALWAKVNMRRVMAKYPFGYTFTNDPATYSNVVMRDVAWFVHGSDYYMPWFSRAALKKFADLQYPDGRLTEYYNAVTGQADDYGLNINDNTPLFIIASNHHFRATGDREWLHAIYANVARAARYIMKQVDDRGLVFCSSKDPRGYLWGHRQLAQYHPELQHQRSGDRD